MNKNIAVFILLSIGFGLGAVYLAKNWLDKNQPTEVQAGQVQVVSINAPLSRGSIIGTKHLSMTTIPESMKPKGAITKLEDAMGMVVKQRLYPGEILISARLAKKGEGSALASLISPNMRAISLRVNDVVGVAGFVLPGNRVDILLTRSGRTEVVLSNIKILAVDQRASNDENKPQIVRAVTVEVDLEQAETLLSSSTKGSIQLALRNPNDESDSLELAKQIDKEEQKIEAKKPVVVAKVSKPESNKVEIIRGLKRDTVKVTND